MINAPSGNLDLHVGVESINSLKFNPLPPPRPNVGPVMGMRVYIFSGTDGTVSWTEVFITEDDGRTVHDAYGFCNSEENKRHWTQYF